MSEEVTYKKVEEGCCHINWRLYLLSDSSIRGIVYLELPHEVIYEKLVCKACKVYTLLPLKEIEIVGEE